ncbi:MAG: helix-turn-helix transcriptional regulator, partial [Duncaniella sp.]|nr:helix-turn-helix transcriptional regulator [Duncaniella sp.]
AARMQRACQLLSKDGCGDKNIAEIADMCGYSDVHYFQRVFKKKFGVNPAEYRAKGE